MKEKIKNFLTEKKELLIFIGALVLIFTLIITIAELTSNTNSIKNPNSDIPAGSVLDDITTTTTRSTAASTTTSEATTYNNTTEKMMLPISSDYVIVREYFDVLDVSTIYDAVIVNGDKMIESKGISYARLDDASFPVKSIFSGEVTNILYDMIEGYQIEITHNDNLISVYKSLASVDVVLGDNVIQGEKIGIAGYSTYDPEAGIHVNLTLKKDNVIINPKYAYGKSTSEIVA